MFIRLRQLLRRGRGQEGAAAVEFAILLPILLLLLAGFFDFGWLFYWQHTVTNASRAGARYAVQANYPLGVRTPYTAEPNHNSSKNIIRSRFSGCGGPGE